MSSSPLHQARAALPREVVVIGGGPAAHRLADAVHSRDDAKALHVTVLCEEPHLPYDRVALSKRLEQNADLTLQPSGIWDDGHITLLLGERADAVDPVARTVTTAAGRILRYDDLVFATGSSAPVPDILGRE